MGINLEIDYRNSSRLYQLRKAIVVMILVGLATVAVSTNRPYMIAATFSYSLLVAGLFWKQERRLHVALMSSGIGIDLLIVLLLELQRQAVKTALSSTLDGIQQLHVEASIVATILYFPTVILGLLRLYGHNTEKIRQYHLKIGLAAFLFRTLGFLLMFSMLRKV